MSRITALIVAAATMMGVASFAAAEPSVLYMGGGQYANGWITFPIPTLGGATGGVAIPNTGIGADGWTIHGNWQDLGSDFSGWIIGLNYASPEGAKHGWEVGAAFNTIEGGGTTDDGWSAHAKFRLAYPNPTMNHLGFALGVLYSRFGDQDLSWWGVYGAGSIPLGRTTGRPVPLLTGGIIWDTVTEFDVTLDEFNYFALLEIPLENRRSAFVVEWKSAFENLDALFSAAFRHRFSEQFAAQAGITNAISSTHLGNDDSRIFASLAWGLGAR